MVGLVSENGITYAGKHLLIDLYGCEHHGSQQEIEQVMKSSCVATGATVLFSYLHPFTGGGVSGAVILAESHQSIHTWPEEKFVSLDIFVCGTCDPYLAVPILSDWFKPAHSSIQMVIRGVTPGALE
jgi:S-adenosylmethionine decarboxylase